MSRRLVVVAGVCVLVLIVALVSAKPVLRRLYLRYTWTPHSSCEQQAWRVADGAGNLAFQRVVLVTIDTLRSDHLRSYGYARTTTPFLDSIAEKGVLFENAITTVSHTAPSHAAMLTGRSPAGHGLRTNGETLDATLPSLACLLRQFGFKTGAFTSVFFLRELTVGFQHVGAERRSGGDTIDEAIDWVEGLGPDEPFLLWVHLYDPHEWLETGNEPEPFLEEVDRSDGMTDSEFFDYIIKHHGVSRAPAPQRPLDWGRVGDTTIVVETTEELRGYVDRYDGLIRYSDAQIERLFRAVEENGRSGDSLWIVTSDHGEGIGGHDFYGHGKHLFGEQLRVPLIVYSSEPSAIARGRRFGSLVSLVDLMPTLVEIFGAVPEGPNSALEGRSLASVLRDPDAPAWQRMAFAERRPVDAARLSLGWSNEDVYVAQSDDYKLIYRTGGETDFFDLNDDSHELRSLSDLDSPQRLALETYLKGKLDELGIDSTAPRPGANAEDLPPELADELRALGYIE